VGMDEARERTALEEKPSAPALVGLWGRDELDGHRAVEEEVVAHVDAAHAPCAQRPHELIALKYRRRHPRLQRCSRCFGPSMTPRDCAGATDLLHWPDPARLAKTQTLRGSQEAHRNAPIERCLISRRDMVIALFAYGVSRKMSKCRPMLAIRQKTTRMR